jgi:Recombination endonuclease VII
MPHGGRRGGAGRKPNPRLTAEQFEAMVQEQGGNCALCSEPGSVGGLVVDVDDLRKRIRGLVHPKCKAFLALGRENPHRFQMAITYLVRRGSLLPETPKAPDLQT